MATQLETQQTTRTVLPYSTPQAWKRQATQAAAEAKCILSRYAPINLAEMEAVALLRRVDTKYVMHTRQLFQALDNLKDRYRVLAFDAVMTFWSSIDEWRIQLKDGGLNGGTKQITEVVVPFGWDDQLRISGGIEYLATEKLTVRGGAYYDGAAAADDTFSPNFPNDGDAIGLAGGFAYSLDGHVELAAAQELAFYSKRTIQTPEGGIAGTAARGADPRRPG